MPAARLVAAVAIAGCLGTSQSDSRRRAVPIDAIDGILAAFGSHTVVALPHAHGAEQAHAFLVSLIRHPGFVRAVDDILVEFGNARYQDVADGFVNGDDVPYESLRLVWRDHTQPSISADFTQHEDFFRTVRAVNAAVGGGRKLRVLLGDPPIDWDAVHTRSEHFRWVEMRDAYPAAVLQTQVIAKRRRALVVYGTAHLQRRNVLSNFDMDDWRAQTLVSLVERAGPTRVFTIAGAAASHAAGWRAPALAHVRGTTLGALDASDFFGPRGRFAVRDGTLVPVAENQWRKLPAEQQFDALLYLGPAPPPTREPLSPNLCAEPGYADMRLRRIALAGLPPTEAERVKTLCGRAGR